MKQVNGFLSRDGTFFEREDEAEFYEAGEALSDLLSQIGINPSTYFDTIEKTSEQTLRYINARNYKNDEDQRRHARANQDHALDTATEEDVTRILQFETGGDEPVPDIRSGDEPEEVPHHGSEYGTRSR